MKTLFVKDYEQKRDWYIIDAAGKPLGRVAAKVAAVVRGKNKASYTPNQAMGGFVIVINADKVVVSGNKASDMLYRHYTGYVGAESGWHRGQKDACGIKPPRPAGIFQSLEGSP